MVAPALPGTCSPTLSSTLWVWPGRAAYLGPSLRLAPHSTSVHCLVVGVDGPFTLTADGTAVSTRSALVPPRTVHQVAATAGERILFCYVDANRARAARQLDVVERRSGAFGFGHRSQSDLIALCRADPADGDAIMDLAVGDWDPPLDPRIRRTVERILDSPAAPTSATELAREECLSVSHFQRLFGREAGTSFRRYRLWARMLRAAQSISDGADLTTAALDAGFATPSHFSDSFLRMFGLTATALVGSGASLVIADR